MRRSIGAMYVAAVLGLVLAGCGKKEEPAPPASPAKQTTPANPAKEMVPERVIESTAKVAQQAAQEANQVKVAAGAAVQKAQEAAKQVAVEQTVCPVLKDQPINKEIFVEYKGKKVYFCCPSCKAAFEKEPEKYVKDLPQFKP